MRNARLLPAVIMLQLTILLLVGSAPAKPADRGGKGPIVVDFSPLDKTAGDLDCKMTLICETPEKEKFRKSVTIKGPATEHTAEDTVRAMKLLLEFEKWHVEEIGKTKFSVAGSKSRASKVEILVEGKIPEANRPKVSQKGDDAREK